MAAFGRGPQPARPGPAWRPGTRPPVTRNAVRRTGFIHHVRPALSIRRPSQSARFSSGTRYFGHFSQPFAPEHDPKARAFDKYGSPPYSFYGSNGVTSMPNVSADSRRTERLEARIPAELKDVFVRAAALRGQSLTDFIVSTVAEAAQQVLRDQDILDLTRRDQIAFAEALAHPPAPSAKLRSAARSYKKRVDA